MYHRNILIEQTDPELFAAIQAENARQEHHIELIASENYASPAVMAAQGSTQIEGLGQQAARIDARLFFRLQQQHGNQVHEWLPEYLKDNPHLCSKGYRPKVDPSRKGLTGGWMPKNAA